MNGVESLLLIIIGFLSLAAWSYLSKVDGYGKFDAFLELFALIYGLVAFIVGNVYFFIWLSKN